jgi:hypothetical protein
MNSMYWWITVESGPVFVEYKKSVSVFRVQRDHPTALEVWAASAVGQPMVNPNPQPKKMPSSISNGNWTPIK